MNSYFDMTKPESRGGFLVNLVLSSGVSISLAYVVASPMFKNHHLFSLAVFTCILFWIFGTSALMAHMVRRLKDADMPIAYAAFSLVSSSAIGILALYFLGILSLNPVYITVVVLGALVLVPLFLKGAKV